MKLIASRLDILSQRVRALLDQLDLPSREEYTSAVSTTFRDLQAVSASSWNLGYITFRPILILLGIVGHYVAIFLRVLLQHTLAHGWIAAREGFFQLRTATIWFVAFQRDLPSSAKYAEFGALAVVVALWLLRRHVKKRRYVERSAAWYRGQKRRALREYHKFVDRIAKTSSFLALLVPHMLYAVLVIGIKRMVPSVVTYLATRTYLCSIISFWHPLYLTVSVLGRLAKHLRNYKEAESSETEQSSSKTKSGKWKGRGMKLKQLQQLEAEMEGLRVEVVDLLKYWVVYAILLAIVRTGKLLPFLGHVLNVTTDDASKTKPGLYAKLRLPGKFVEEMTLVFFVWLRLMPISAMEGENNENQKKPSVKQKGPTHRPLDILYDKLSPVVLSVMNSSAFLNVSQRALGESRYEGSSTFLSIVMQKFKSFLDLVVLVRLIRKETEEWLMKTIVESSALLPAVTTILMPSYFTCYGVIYVSLVVPAGYSIRSCDALRTSSPNLETMMPKIDDASRYLQFWVVHAAVSLLLGCFAPLLAWIPLSTHATWLLWAYVQLESSTRKIYGWLEAASLEDTAVVLVRSTSRVIAALPSNVNDTADGEENDASPAPTEVKKSKTA